MITRKQLHMIGSLSLFWEFTWNRWQLFAQFSTTFSLESWNMLAFNFLVRGNIAFFLIFLALSYWPLFKKNQGIWEFATFKSPLIYQYFRTIFPQPNVPFVSHGCWNFHLFERFQYVLWAFKWVGEQWQSFFSV